MSRDVAAFLYGCGLLLVFIALFYALDRICWRILGFQLEGSLKKLSIPRVTASAVVLLLFFGSFYYALFVALPLIFRDDTSHYRSTAMLGWNVTLLIGILIRHWRKRPEGKQAD